MQTHHKKITSFILAATLSGFMASSLVMAGNSDSSKRRGPNVERLASKLELSDAQVPLFKEVMNEQGSKRKALHTSFRESMNVQKEEMLSALSQILDEGQLAEFTELMERNRKKEHKKGMKKNKES